MVSRLKCESANCKTTGRKRSFPKDVVSAPCPRTAPQARRSPHF